MSSNESAAYEIMTVGSLATITTFTTVPFIDTFTFITSILTCYRFISCP